MLFSAFSNDGLGHKDMTEMLSHSGFGEVVEVRKRKINRGLFSEYREGGGLLGDNGFPRSVGQTEKKHPFVHAKIYIYICAIGVNKFVREEDVSASPQ